VLLVFHIFRFLLLVLLLVLLHPSLPPACAACPNDQRPYCVATAAFGPRTFANCCYAKCNGIKILNNVLHPGGCKDACRSCDLRVEKPLCCSGRTYKSGCLAVCNGENTGQCSPGRCSTCEYFKQCIGHMRYECIKSFFLGQQQACRTAFGLLCVYGSGSLLVLAFQASCGV
jgi:hypothetical protein